MTAESLRLDYKIIYEIVEPGARVLDLGCGSGDLLYHLAGERMPRCRGSNSTTRRSTSALKRV